MVIFPLLIFCQFSATGNLTALWNRVPDGPTACNIHWWNCQSLTCLFFLSASLDTNFLSNSQFSSIVLQMAAQAANFFHCTFCLSNQYVILLCCAYFWNKEKVNILMFLLSHFAHFLWERCQGLYVTNQGIKIYNKSSSSEKVAQNRYYSINISPQLRWFLMIVIVFICFKIQVLPFCFPKRLCN